MHIDDAYDFLIQHLAAIPDLSGHAAQVERNKQYSCDLWIPNVILKYWQPRINNLTYGDLEEDHFRPLYDAAWELCRIGILRPGQFAPRGQAMGGGLFSGDGFSITQFGR